MSKKDLQKTIRCNGGMVISEGTLRQDVLLQAVGQLMGHYRLRTPLLKKIGDLFERVSEGIPGYLSLNGDVYIPEERWEDAAEIWANDVFDYMNEVAPPGYYFGSSEGDGACIGFFKEGFDV